MILQKDNDDFNLIRVHKSIAELRVVILVIVVTSNNTILSEIATSSNTVNDPNNVQSVFIESGAVFAYEPYGMNPQN